MTLTNPRFQPAKTSTAPTGSLDITLFFNLLLNIETNIHGGLIKDAGNQYGYKFIRPIEEIIGSTGPDTTNYVVDEDEFLVDNDGEQLIDG